MIKWLSNQIGFIGCFTLCFNEKHYKEICKSLNIDFPSEYKSVTVTANAWVKRLVNGRGHETYLVCLDEDMLANKPLSVVCGFLAHEAVHVWQFSCEYMGELNPSIEFEAYCIQHITEQLISELFNRKFRKLNSVRFGAKVNI